jgi:sugar/nucleoside kinase (ribokinase family)
MKKYFSISVILVSILLFASCTSSRTIPISENRYDGMEIFTSNVPLGRDYEEVRIIHVTGGWLSGPRTKMNRLVRQAKRAGANGLVDVNYAIIDGKNSLTGTAVRFK